MNQPSVNVTLGPGAPVLIPCPLPRSVTFTVRLGECLKACSPRGFTPGHISGCPGQLIRVSGSISGKTWEESEVTDLDVPGRLAGTNAGADLWRAFRERWALVKALVLGHTAWDYTMSPAKAIPLATITAMLAQRDAVYAALADMALAERAAEPAHAAIDELLPASLQCRNGLNRLSPPPHARPSATWLAAYIEHLIEQVGVLP